MKLPDENAHRADGHAAIDRYFVLRLAGELQARKPNPCRSRSPAFARVSTTITAGTCEDCRSVAWFTRAVGVVTLRLVQQSHRRVC